MLRFSSIATAIALLSLGTFLTTAACSVVVGGDDSDLGGAPASGGKASGGSGGRASGGQGSGGKASGGTAGESSGGAATGGLGGTPTAKLDCQADGTAEGSYAPPSSSSECSECLLANCETSFKTCYSLEPDSACLYGSTSLMVDGGTVEGEFDCMLACFTALVEDDEFLGDETDLETCQLQCGSAECDDEAAGRVTTELSECMLGIPTQDDGCQAECLR